MSVWTANSIIGSEGEVLYRMSALGLCIESNKVSVMNNDQELFISDALSDNNSVMLI